MSEIDTIPERATGLRLCKIVRDELLLAEPVQFIIGRPGVVTTLRRAAISGHVGGEPEPEDDFFADVLSDDGSIIDTIRLDRRSWNSLKNKWMRCRMEPPHEAP